MATVITMSNTVNTLINNHAIQGTSTETLKTMWDLWDNYMEREHESPLRFHYEDIHRELNDRGHGEYCAV